HRLSLKDCLDMALANNARLASKDYAIEGAQWKYAETKVHGVPIFEYSNKSAPVPRDARTAARSFFEGDVTFFNASRFAVGMPLTGFGQLSVVQDLARKGIEAARAEKARDAVRLQSDIKQLYYGVLLSQDLRELGEDAVRKIEDQLEKEEETREHSPYEILKLKVFKLELEKRVQEAATKGDMAKEALKLQVGLGEHESIALASSNLEPAHHDFKTLEQYLEEAVAVRPDSNLVDIGVAAKRLEFDLEKKKLLPRLGLGGFFEIARTAQEIRNVSTTDAFVNPFNYMRAGLGIEIKGTLDFKQAHSRINRLESEYQKAQLERAFAKQGIELEVKESFGEVKRLKESVVMAEQKQRMARQMMFLSKSNIEVGVGEEQEYTDALQLVLASRGEYLKTVFDYNTALAKFEEKIGRKNHAME
ncbi:MAG: TolC family protein, partial [bacterium]|nr:TolC family protein [bacterium]